MKTETKCFKVSDTRISPHCKENQIIKNDKYKYLIDKSIDQTTRFGTNSVERKNLDLRIHLKRLNCRAICFSKSVVVLSAVLKIYFWSGRNPNLDFDYFKVGCLI
nr:IS1 family transposase [Moheibacter sediminis]